MWAGRLSVRHVLYLSEHLTRNPMSRVFALRGGDPALQGWDAKAVIAARTHNAIVGLIQGLSGADNPDAFIYYPGSENEPETVVQPQTLAQVAASFTKFMEA